MRAQLPESGQLEQLRVAALRDDLVVVALLQVPKPLRRNGIGTESLRELTTAADCNGWILAGTPDTSFGSSRAGLDRLYRRFGFVSNRGRHADFTTSESLTRRPRPPATLTVDLGRAEALAVTTNRGMAQPNQLPHDNSPPYLPALKAGSSPNRGCG